MFRHGTLSPSSSPPKRSVKNVSSILRYRKGDALFQPRAARFKARASCREFDGLELGGQDDFQQFAIVGVAADQMLDPRRLGPATALFHQGLALPFHVSFDPALEDIDHLKFDVVEVQL